MNRSKILTWENFKASILVGKEQRTNRVFATPKIEIFWDGKKMLMGLRIQTSAGSRIPEELLRLSSFEIEIVTLGKETFVEVTTTSIPVRREFYHFAVAVSERVIIDSASALDALKLESDCFGELLKEKALLGQEKQTGLLGELLFLERLVVAKGPTALDSWGGPQGEPHDFRLDDNEFEVKSTIGTQRIHTIHGVEQLVPSKSCVLYLFSVMLGPPGSSGSFSLPEKAAHLETFFAKQPSKQKVFIRALENIGLRKEDFHHYTRRYSYRRPCAIVRVDKAFPAITRPTIQKSMSGLANRVHSLQYSVDIEGLEKEEGTPEFISALP